MIRCTALPILGLALVLASPTMAQKQDVAAVVNGKNITTEEFRQTLLLWYGREVLDEMIEAELVAQAAERMKVTVTEEQLNERLEAIKQRMDRDAMHGAGPPFDIWLAESGMTLPHYKARVRTMMLLEAVVSDQVRVTPQEVSRYYERNIRRYRRPAMVNISVITVNTEADAKKVYDLLTREGQSWADVAEKYNTDPRTMANAGEVGFIPDDGSPIAKAAFALVRDGEVSQPIAFEGKYYVVRRIDRKGERTLPFEEVKDDIERELRARKTKQLMEETRAALINSAVIQRLIELPPRTGSPGSP